MKENDRDIRSRRKLLLALVALPFAACHLYPQIAIAPAVTNIVVTPLAPSTTPDSTLLKPRRSPVLGFRNDVPELMESLPGASFIRTVGDRDRFKTEPWVKKAIDAAGKQNLSIYYTDNPQKPIAVPMIRQKVDEYINYAEGNIKVVGSTNEVDDVFWEGNFATVAPFILVQSDYIFNKYRGVRVAIGGLADTAKITDLIYRLGNPDYTSLPDFDLLSKKERDYIGAIKFNPKRFIYTFHAYYGPSSVVEAIETLKKELARNGIVNPVIWGEEIGMKDDKSDIPRTLDTALATGASAVMVHELPNVEHYGYMDFINGGWVKNKYYSSILNWSQNHLI